MLVGFLFIYFALGAKITWLILGAMHLDNFCRWWWWFRERGPFAALSQTATFIENYSITNLARFPQFKNIKTC